MISRTICLEIVSSRLFGGDKGARGGQRSSRFSLLSFGSPFVDCAASAIAESEAVGGDPTRSTRRRLRYRNRGSNRTAYHLLFGGNRTNQSRGTDWGAKNTRPNERCVQRRIRNQISSDINKQAQENSMSGTNRQLKRVGVRETHCGAARLDTHLPPRISVRIVRAQFKHNNAHARQQSELLPFQKNKKQENNVVFGVA